MSVALPKPIAAYLEAKQNYDSDALLATLSTDAVMTDEGTTHSGPDAIRAWNDKASKDVAATYAVKDFANVEDRTIVAVQVAGNFPTSPVTLYFHVKLDGDRIASLTVLP